MVCFSVELSVYDGQASSAECYPGPGALSLSLVPNLLRHTVALRMVHNLGWLELWGHADVLSKVLVAATASSKAIGW